MWSAVWFSLLLLTGGVVKATPHLALQNIEAPVPDEETIEYLLPSLSSRYAPSTSTWSNIMDPRLYILTEMAKQQEDYESNRVKRKMPSLSVINPFEVLRERLLLEISRKKAREGEAMQAERNRIFLKNIGKRTELDYQRYY